MSTKHVHGAQPSDSDDTAAESAYAKPHDAEEDQLVPGDDPNGWSGTHHAGDEATTAESAETERATDAELNEHPDRADYAHEAETAESPATERDVDGTYADTERPATESETYDAAVGSESYDPAVDSEPYEPLPATAEHETAAHETATAVPEAKSPVSAETNGDVSGPLFAEDELERLRTEWRELQGNFVDNPQDAVTRADELVTSTIDHLTAAFAERKQTLGQRWTDQADTEDLRNALRGYRDFFNQLLSTP
ncbi:hypothetical protein AB0H76_01270 [Nocardia sp. NPDC050712]|uniref:hypothetical protein n=1 Tax=Nocardia sp. NPDC050712 TaxID=3155518 RepID=UPI00340907BC